MIFVVESNYVAPVTLFASEAEARAEVARIEQQGWEQYNCSVGAFYRPWVEAWDAFRPETGMSSSGIAPGIGQHRCKRIMRKVDAWWSARDTWWAGE